MAETKNIVRLAMCWIATTAGLIAATASYAQVGPPADTPIPAQFQDSYKVYLDMKTKAVPPKHVPNWSGLWTRDTSAAGLVFDDKQPLPISAGHISAVLTPEYQKMFDKKLRDVADGKEWDPLSDCLPSGYPRWLTEPFLREAVVTSKETWWIQEQQNEIRRIYTDGRGHVPEDEAYPLWDGDSIGVWDGNTLVVHTIRVKPGQYNRSQPDYSDQTSTVERIRLLNHDRMEDDVTVWDPLSLKKPWRVQMYWKRVTTPGLRIDTWSCEENSNVSRNADGSTKLLLPGDPGYKDPDKLNEDPSISNPTPAAH